MRRMTMDEGMVKRSIAIVAKENGQSSKDAIRVGAQAYKKVKYIYEPLVGPIWPLYHYAAEAVELS
jgi:hypothetical protein